MLQKMKKLLIMKHPSDGNFPEGRNNQDPGVVILHIENKSAPLRGQKIINLPQNRGMNFQKFPYFNKNGQMFAKI